MMVFYYFRKQSSNLHYISAFLDKNPLHFSNHDRMFEHVFITVLLLKTLVQPGHEKTSKTLKVFI